MEVLYLNRKNNLHSLNKNGFNKESLKCLHLGYETRN